MSRIGRMIIEIPKGVKTTIEGDRILVEGPKGKLSSPLPGGITATMEDGGLSFKRELEDGPTRAKHGLARALAANCVTGVTKGFMKQLQIIGVGYRVNVEGQNIEFHLGYSHPIQFPLPAGITANAEQNRKTKSIILTVAGIDKQLVGQVAANMRSLRKPEPYKGKGVRYINETILRKSGKSGK